MSLVSFSHKFVFIKTRKVGGTSVEAFLRQFMGPDDIVPAVTPRDEFHCAKRKCFSRNYLVSSEDEETYTRLVLSNDFDAASSFLKDRKKIFTSHMGYGQIANALKRRGKSIEDFFVFTIDRHPYSWLISMARYDNARYNIDGSFGDEVDLVQINQKIKRFLASPEASKKINWPMYATENVVRVDRIIRYEKIEVELPEVLENLGLQSNERLPKLKASHVCLDPFGVLNKENRSLAAEIFESAFTTLGYKKSRVKVV